MCLQCSGGKLPGICGEDCPSGCTKFMAGSFSSRIMWRAKGSIMSYMYYPGKTDACGDNWLWNKKLKAGTWYFQKTYVRLNTLGAPNALAHLRMST